MDDVTPANVVPIPPRLEYAAGEVVGNMALSRVDGVTTITVRPSWRKMISVGWSIAAALFWWFSLYPFVLLFGQSMLGAPMAVWNPLFIPIGVGLAITAIIYAKHFVFVMAGHRWIVSPVELQFVGRRLNEIVKQNFPRATIGYLKVERLRIKGQIRKRLFLAIVKPDGNKVAILGGKRDELEFACKAFSQAMALPVDPFNEAAFPNKPAGSRVKSRVMVNGVALSLHPPLVGIDGWTIIIASLVLPACTIEILHRQAPMFVDSSALSVWGIIASLGFSVLLGAGLLSLRSQLRRVINLVWAEGVLHLTERSVFKPCSESWKVTDASWLRLASDLPAGNAGLILRLPDGSEVPLVGRARSGEVRFIHDSLVAAITLPRQEIKLAAASPAS